MLDFRPVPGCFGKPIELALDTFGLPVICILDTGCMLTDLINNAINNAGMWRFDGCKYQKTELP